MLGSKRWFLVAILAATSGFGWAQTVADGEALLASGNREGAAAAFEAAMKAGPAAERPKAGSLMILAWNDARRHDMVEAKFAAAQTAAAGTPYDAETRLYRARSLWRNAADTTTALSVLREITAPAGGTASGKSDAVIKQANPPSPFRVRSTKSGASKPARWRFPTPPAKTSKPLSLLTPLRLLPTTPSLPSPAPASPRPSSMSSIRPRHASSPWAPPRPWSRARSSSAPSS